MSHLLSSVDTKMDNILIIRDSQYFIFLFTINSTLLKKA